MELVRIGQNWPELGGIGLDYLVFKQSRIKLLCSWQEAL